MSDTLPVVDVLEPLRGFKFAEVRGAHAPAVHPSGRFHRHAYEHRGPATAVCHRRHHTAPVADCTCGFYAVTDPHALPTVTEHHPDMVLLEVELAGTVVEHEAGLRGEQQTVLGAFFPRECHRCRRPATRVQPGDVWRSVCHGCDDAALNLADATAALGIDVGFSTVTIARMPKQVMHALRAVLMCVLMAVLAVVCAIQHVGVVATAGAAAAIVATIGFAVGVMATRAPRRREMWFQAQCACLAVASLAVVIASS